MNAVMAAAEILENECNAARQQCDADPGNVLLAMRLSRLQIITSMVRTFGVGSDIASGYIPAEFVPAADMDGRSSASDELAGSCHGVTVTDVRASERGGTEADDFPSRRQQISLPLDT